MDKHRGTTVSKRKATATLDTVSVPATVDGMEIRLGMGSRDPMRHPVCGTHWPASVKKCPGCGEKA